VTELDFLPQSYHEGLRRREQTRRNVLLCVGLGLAMISLHGLSLVRINAAQAELTSLRNGTGGWQSARDQLAMFKNRRDACYRQLDLIDGLEDAAPLDAAIGEATRLLSESMALTTVQVDAGTVEEPQAGTPDTPTASIPRATRVRLVGVAATDVEVGIFLGKLSACPVFSDVTLSYSRDARSSGRKMREFEVKFTLRPVEETP
jgi:hypothetical protein